VRSTFLPLPDVHHPKQLKHLGFMRVDKRMLAAGALGFATIMMSIPTLPASAELVTEDVVTEQVQTFVASKTTAADVTTAAHEDYTFSEYSLVYNPVRADSPVGDGFGYRIPPCAGCSSYHRGVDYNPGNGTAVRSIADGVVTEVGNPSGSLGVYVVVAHQIGDETVSTLYGHMAYGSMNLGVGSKVKAGDTVGRVGSTGQSTGPHLYFEVRLNGTTPVNPIPWLAAHVNS